MRPSLKNIEFIENYILGNFDPSEQELAKKRIEDSPELSQLLETQQCIYSATKRQALRSEIQSYAPTASPTFFHQYRYWFAGGLAILGIIGFLFINSFKKENQENNTSTFLQNQLAKNTEDVTPWIPFDIQTFSLIAEKGATLVGNDGTLIILGENSLLDAQGNRVSGKVEAELIEALDWEDMIAYNLTTTSGGKALSSGGMMRIRYKQNGKEVYVDPQKPMHIEIPTDDYNADMKVWEGEVKNGLLDWKNPQEIERYLTKIDLKYLDFIPTGFDAEVANLLPYKSHTELSDQLVDSLYYSISVNRELYSVDRNSKSSFVNDCYFNIPKRNDLRGYWKDQTKPLLKGKNSVTAQIIDPEGNPIAGMNVILRMDRYLEHEESVSTDENGYFTFSKFYPGEVSVYASLHSPDQDEILWKYCLETTFMCPKNPQNYTLKKPLVAEYSSMINFNQLSVSPKTGGIFIDPLSIKTLKTSRFKNTFIATQEFETRLQAMHAMKKGAVILETYVKNISEPLWKCDELAAKLVTGEEKEIFKTFAAQRLTNVKNDGIHQEALLEYYTNQRKAFRAEKRKNLQDNQSKTTNELLALSRSIESALESPEHLAMLHAEANGRIPSNSKMMQVSSRTGVTARNVGSGSYSFTWYSNSWCNIDRLLRELGPMPYVTEVNTNLNEKEMTVYQCVRLLNNVIGLNNELGSYQALSPKNGYQGETFCMGMLMQGTQLLFDARSYYPSRDRSIDLNLEPTSPEDFYLELCSLAPEESDVAKRLRTEQGMLLAQAKVKETQAPLILKLQKARNGITEDVVVYNQLFDALSRIANPRQLSGARLP